MTKQATIIKNVGEVLGGYPTSIEKRVSKRTGREYNTEVVSKLTVYVEGDPEKKTKNDGSVKYSYDCVDSKNISFKCSVPTELTGLHFGSRIQLYGITCGLIPNTTKPWFSAIKAVKVGETK